MSQSRNRKGIDFEIDRTKENGWERTPTSPRIKWSGGARSNWKKIREINANPSKFKPLIEESIFDKYDSTTQNGDRVELKKINKKSLDKFQLYSEPIFCVKNWGDIPIILEIFGSISDVSHINKNNVRDHKDEITSVVKECAVGNYNNFLSGVMKNVGSEILNRIIGTSTGVEIIDGFIPREDLEFRWEITKGWLGFNRSVIQFRIRQTSNLSLALKQEVYKLIETVENKESLIENLILSHYNNKI